MINTFDIIVLIIFAIFVFLGYKRGLIDEATKLIGMSAGIIAAIANYRNLEGLFGNIFGANSGLSLVLNFLIIFLFVYFFVQLGGYILGATLKKLNLNWLNRSLGGLFGAIKAVVILICIVWFLTVFQEMGLDKQLRNSSVSYVAIKNAQETVSNKLNLDSELKGIRKKLRNMFMLNDEEVDTSI